MINTITTTVRTTRTLTPDIRYTDDCSRFEVVPSSFISGAGEVVPSVVISGAGESIPSVFISVDGAIVPSVISGAGEAVSSVVIFVDEEAVPSVISGAGETVPSVVILVDEESVPSVIISGDGESSGEAEPSVVSSSNEVLEVVTSSSIFVSEPVVSVCTATVVRLSSDSDGELSSIPPLAQKYSIKNL